eukprot:TRINITY_DN22662_c0_g1_i1.p1 TRINITY_DN22662_c0_g1~~TRINITY_DN22662_c0_g1_i1.p1  ORF type:complete len:125 (+),score=27.00 TRINITY_DN22662_c0_g1_i1:73-447(+)
MEYPCYVRTPQQTFAVDLPCEGSVTDLAKAVAEIVLPELCEEDTDIEDPLSPDFSLLFAGEMIVQSFKLLVKDQYHVVRTLADMGIGPESTVDLQWEVVCSDCGRPAGSDQDFCAMCGAMFIRL